LADIKAEYDKPEWKKFMGSLFILTCVGTLHSRVDTVMLRYLKDSSQVGIYYMAERDATALFFFQYIMSIIISPAIARLNIRDEKEKLQKMINRTVRWVMLFSLPVFFIIVAFSGQIMRLSGSEFLPGRTALIIICCGHIIDVAFGPVLNFVLMTGYEKYNTIAMAIGVLMNVILNLILTPRMGITGTAIAAAGSTVFWNIYLFIIIKKKTGIRTWILG
jgi:O-antigen/teichoic acid export membrane protein